MSYIYEAALEYIRRGWSVIPIRANSKIPAVQWQEFQHRHATEAELEHWFNNGLEYNIGIVTGNISSLFVVDEDAYKDSYQTFEAYPTGFIVSTPSGGRHYYYHGTGSTGAGVFGPGIDTRGEGGYVVAPPSVIRGAPYEWVSKSYLNTAPGTAAPTIEKSPPTLHDDFIHDIITRGFTEGRHNQQLHMLTKQLLQVVLHGTVEEKVQAVRTLLLALDLRDPTPQAMTGNFEPTFKSALKYVGVPQLPAEVSVEDAPDEFLSIASYRELAEKYRDWEPEYLFHDFLPREGLIFVAGSPGTGKTWLLIDVAVSIALGPDYPGIYNKFVNCLDEPAPVLFFQQEDHSPRVIGRVHHVLHQKLRLLDEPLVNRETGMLTRDNPYDAPIYFHEHSQFRLNSDRAFEVLEQRIVETGAKVVCFDPFNKMASDAANYFLGDSEHLHRFTRLVNKYNILILVAHHTKKSATFEDGRSGMFGSTMVDAGTHGILYMVKDATTGKIKLKRTGKNFNGDKAWNIDLRIDDRYAIYSAEIEEIDAAGQLSPHEQILQYIEENHPCRHADIAKDTGISKSTVTRTLNAMLEQEVVDRDERGLYTLVIAE